MDGGRRLKLLLDTNIPSEILLEQSNADEARALLSSIEDHEFYISDFSLYSIGIQLFRAGRHVTLRSFIQEMILATGTRVVSLDLDDMDMVLAAAHDYGLDFDDSYQYAIAGKMELTIVSFDHDFDRTERGRKTPAEILAG
jgi:predicted nucleic acid-binding protein